MVFFGQDKSETATGLDLTAAWPGLPSAPRTVDVSITGCCNLRCRYCAYADEMTARSDLSTERWLKMFEEFGQMAVQHVCLSGGEVFTRPDFFVLVDSLLIRT